MDVQIIHKGIITNGQLIFDYPLVYTEKLKQLEGKRFDLSLEIEHEKVTTSQWGYYYGGIIRGTCMQTTTFETWTAEEIHEALLATLRTNKKVVIYPNGTEKIMEYTDDLKQYNKSQMAAYIDAVMNFLAEMDIHPLPPDYYKYGVNIQRKQKP